MIHEVKRNQGYFNVNSETLYSQIRKPCEVYMFQHNKPNTFRHLNHSSTFCNHLINSHIMISVIFTKILLIFCSNFLYLVEILMNLEKESK